MALTKEQKKEMLQQMLDSVETDLYRQQLEHDAFVAEAAAAKDDGIKKNAQDNADNVGHAITRLTARQAAWKKTLDQLG